MSLIFWKTKTRDLELSCFWKEREEVRWSPGPRRQPWWGAGRKVKRSSKEIFKNSKSIFILPPRKFYLDILHSNTMVNVIQSKHSPSKSLPAFIPDFSQDTPSTWLPKPERLSSHSASPGPYWFNCSMHSWFLAWWTRVGFLRSSWDASLKPEPRITIWSHHILPFKIFLWGSICPIQNLSELTKNSWISSCLPSGLGSVAAFVWLYLLFPFRPLVHGSPPSSGWALQWILFKVTLF